MAVKPNFYEWFSRGLVAGQHYLEVPAEPLEVICPALLAAMLIIEGGGIAVWTCAPSQNSHAAWLL